MKRINRFMQSFLLLCVACFTLMVGCIHEDLSAYASVDYKIVSVDAQANNVSYTITANTDWTISSNEDWCTPTPDSGTGTASINIIIASNPSSEERTANLTLTCGGKDTSVEVIQAGLVETLEVSPTQYTVDNSSQDANIAIMANTSWTVTSSTDGTEDNWLKLNTTSGSNNGFINVSIEENTTYEERSAVVTVFSKRDGETSLVRTVTITQLSQGSPSLILSQTSLTVSSLDQTKYVTYVSNIADVVASSDFAWCTASVEDGSIKIDVAKNTAVSSRTATVTVIGVVEGETVVTQILVSQSGVGAPEIMLVNDYMSFGYTGGEASFSWVAYSGVSVLLGNTSPWITATKEGSAVKAVVGENNAEDSRVGYIELIATNSSGEQTFYYITIYQSGVGAPSITAVPSSISLGSSAGTGSVFVVVDNDAASLTGYTTSNSWITVNNVTRSSDGKEYLVDYTYQANSSDASRNAMITLEFMIGSQSYLFSISAVQAGLGTPSISTLENIFLQADQTEHTQSIWFMDGDKTNVDYEVIATSYSTSASGSTGSVTAKEWITDAKIIEDAGNYYLYVETLENTESEVRYGEITIIATRDDSSTVIKISVTQGAHAGAGISGLTQEVFFDWEGMTDAKYYFSALNNSFIEVAGTTTTDGESSKWIHDVTIVNIEDGVNSSEDYEGSYDKVLKFTVDPYYGGETGSFREGIITLKADNGNSNVVYYDVKVCQYEPSAALAAITDDIYLTFDAQNGLVTPVDLMNNAKIVKVYSSASWLAIDKGYSYINGEGTTVNVADGTFCDWTSSTTSLAYTSGEESFFYNVEKFDGGTDESRTAYIYVTVQNNNANTMTYTITVTQGDPMEALADVPEKIYVGYSSATYTFEITDKSGVAEYKAEFVSNEKAYTTDEDWLRYIDPASSTAVTSGGTAEVSFNVGQYDGEEGETRTGVLAVTVSGEHANDQTYYVEIIQGEATENTLTVPEYMEYSYLATSDVFKVESTGADNSFTMQWDDNWLTMVDTDNNNATISQSGGRVTPPSDGISKLSLTVTEYTNSTEPYREQVVTYTATGDNYRPVVAYTTIRQNAQGEAGISGATTLYLDYDDTADKTLTFSLANSSEITKVEVTSGNTWLTATESTTTANTVTYSAVQYNGDSGEYRLGTFVVTVSNNNVDTSTIEITVIQGSPADAVATVPVSISIDYPGFSTTTTGTETVGDGKFTFDLDEGTTVTSVAPYDTTWLSDVAWTTDTATGIVTVTYSCESYDGLDPRTGYFVVTVSSDDVNNQLYYIEVTQGTAIEPVISALTSYSHDYRETIGSDGNPYYYELPFTVSGDDVEEVTATISKQFTKDGTTSLISPWFYLYDIDSSTNYLYEQTIDATDGLFNYGLTEYDGSLGDYRATSLILTAKGSSMRPAVTYVDIYQFAQGAADFDLMISEAYHSADANSDILVDPDLYNDAKIIKVTADQGASSTTWLTVSTTASSGYATTFSNADGVDQFYYAVTKYEDSTEPRVGTISITVENSNSQTMTQTLKVTQGAATAPYMSFTGDVTFSSSEIDTTPLKIAPTSATTDSYIVSVEPAVSTDWLSICDTETGTFDDAGFSGKASTDAIGNFYLKSTENLTGADRSVTLAVTVANTASSDQIVQYVKVTQVAAGDSTVSSAPEITADAAASTAAETEILYIDTPYSTYTSAATTEESWITDLSTSSPDATTGDITVTYKLTKNDTGLERIGYIVVTTTATGSGTDAIVIARNYIKVTQSGSNITMTPSITEITASASGVGTPNSNGSYSDFGSNARFTYTVNGVEIPLFDDTISIAENDTFYQTYNYRISLPISSSNTIDWVHLLDEDGYVMTDYYMENRNSGWGFQYAIDPNTTGQIRQTYITCELYESATGQTVAVATIPITQEADDESITNLVSSVNIDPQGYVATVGSADYTYSSGNSFYFQFNVSAAIGASSVSTTDGYIEVKAMNTASSWLFPTGTATSSYAEVANGMATVNFNASANLTGSERTGDLQLTAYNASGVVTAVHVVSVVQPAYNLGLSVLPFAQYATTTSNMGATGVVTMQFSETAATYDVSIYTADTRAIAANDWIALVSKGDYDAYNDLVDAYETALAEDQSIEANATATATALATLQDKFTELYSAATADTFEGTVDTDGQADIYYICSQTSSSERSATIQVVSADSAGNVGANQYYEVTQRGSLSSDVDSSDLSATKFAEQITGTPASGEYTKTFTTALDWNVGTVDDDVVFEYDYANIAIESIEVGGDPNCTFTMPDSYKYDGKFIPSMTVTNNTSGKDRDIKYTVVVNFKDNSFYVFYVEYTQSPSILSMADDTSTEIDNLYLRHNGASDTGATAKYIESKKLESDGYSVSDTDSDGNPKTFKTIQTLSIDISDTDTSDHYLYLSFGDSDVTNLLISQTDAQKSAIAQSSIGCLDVYTKDGDYDSNKFNVSDEDIVDYTSTSTNDGAGSVTYYKIRFNVTNLWSGSNALYKAFKLDLKYIDGSNAVYYFAVKINSTK